MTTSHPLLPLPVSPSLSLASPAGERGLAHGSQSSSGGQYEPIISPSHFKSFSWRVVVDKTHSAGPPSSGSSSPPAGIFTYLYVLSPRPLCDWSTLTVYRECTGQVGISYRGTMISGKISNPNRRVASIARTAPRPVSLVPIVY